MVIFLFDNNIQKNSIKITCLAWIIAKLITWKLWLCDRFFPIISPFEFLPKMTNTCHLTLLIISLALLIILFFYPDKRIIPFFLFIEIFSCILDILRWQPWEYQFLLIFIFYLFTKKDSNQFQYLLLFLIATTYIYSGLHKLNGAFLYSIWNKLILKKIFHFSSSFSSNTFIHYLGLLIAIIEVVIGFGLLFFKYKKPMALLAIVMHVVILLFLGPIGLNSNNVVWSWNVVMILYVYLLCFKNEPFIYNFKVLKNKLNLLVFILIGVLPSMNFIGKWDNYLSFNLYSGSVPQAVICIDNIKVYPELNPYISMKNSNYCENKKSINITNWAYKELNIPGYPEERVYKDLQKQIVLKYPKLNISMIQFSYPFLNDNIKNNQLNLIYKSIYIKLAKSFQKN